MKPHRRLGGLGQRTLCRGQSHPGRERKHWTILDHTGPMIHKYPQSKQNPNRIQTSLSRFLTSDFRLQSHVKLSEKTNESRRTKPPLSLEELQRVAQRMETLPEAMERCEQDRKTMPQTMPGTSWHILLHWYVCSTSTARCILLLLYYTF